MMGASVAMRRVGLALSVLGVVVAGQLGLLGCTVPGTPATATDGGPDTSNADVRAQDVITPVDTGPAKDSGPVVCHFDTAGSTFDKGCVFGP
jgi:hypothetical protein